MALPVFVPGQVLASADVNNWLLPLAAYKSADQSVTSSTTLVNDTALSVSVAANAIYYMWMYLNYEGGTAGASDLKFAWTFPTGLGIRYNPSLLNNSGNLTGFQTNIQTDILVARSAGAGVLQSVKAEGTVNVGSTAGTLQLQWAQNISSGTATIVHVGSALVLQRIS